MCIFRVCLLNYDRNLWNLLSFIFVDPQILNNSAYESEYEYEYEYEVVGLSISACLTGALISKIWLRTCD